MPQFANAGIPVDGSVTAAKLYAPGVADGYSLLWHALKANGDAAVKTIVAGPNPGPGCAVIMPAPANDLAIRWVYRNQTFALARTEDDYLDPDNYKHYISAGNPVNQRHAVWKRIAAANTFIAGEAGYTPGSPEWGLAMFSLSGTTLKGFRSDMGVAKFSATDSALTSGKIGIGGEDAYLPVNNIAGPVVIAPQSKTPRPWQIWEVPVIAKVGGAFDYFAPEIPDELQPTCAALIKTGKDGKPVDYRAIVRLFDNSEPDLLRACKDYLNAKIGARRLDPIEAIVEAKRLDDELDDDAFEDKSADEMKGWTP